MIFRPAFMCGTLHEGPPVSPCESIQVERPRTRPRRKRGMMRAEAAMDIPQKFNIGAEFVERNLRAGRAENVAIWSGGKTITYAELAKRVDRTAAALLKAGVEPEQRVLFVMPDSPE